MNPSHFGRNDKNKARRDEEKARAKALFKAQLQMASDKRKNAIKKHLATQQAESEVLRRTKTELIEESISNYNNAVRELGVEIFDVFVSPFSRQSKPDLIQQHLPSPRSPTISRTKLAETRSRKTISRTRTQRFYEKRSKIVRKRS